MVRSKMMTDCGGGEKMKKKVEKRDTLCFGKSKPELDACHECVHSFRRVCKSQQLLLLLLLRLTNSHLQQLSLGTKAPELLCAARAANRICSDTFAAYLFCCK